MGLESIIFLIDMLLTGVGVKICARMRSARVRWTQSLLLVFWAGAVSLVPAIGFVLSWILLVYLLVEFTELSMADAIWTLVGTKMLIWTLLLLAGVIAYDDPAQFLTLSKE
jgi:hypothetical protein